MATRRIHETIVIRSMVWIKVTINNCCSDDSNRSTQTAATTDRTRRIRLQLSKLLGGRYLSGVRQFVVIYATATTDGGRSVAKRQIHLSSLWANDHVKACVYNWDIRLSANSGLWRVRFANCTRFDESMHGQDTGEKYQGSHFFGFERATLQFGWA